MIVHVFNSAVVSGPETLVLPALRNLPEPVQIIFLSETRRAEEAKDPMEYAEKLGHRVHSVEVRGRWDRKAFSALRDLLDRLGPRIVHAHDVKASLYVERAAKLRTGFAGALISTHHGVSGRKGKIRLYEEIYVRRILRDFDRVIAVCESDRHSIVRRGVPSSRVDVQINGADRPKVQLVQRSDLARRIRERWREKMPNLPRSEETIFIGAVARLSSEKRHDRMLHVLRELGNPNAVLVCFGTGPEEKRIRELARSLGIADQVFLMGYSAEIGSEMAGFNLVLCLSDGEGIPIALIEAGWAATPVFATSVGGIPDLISSNEVGRLVDKSESDQEIARKLRAFLQDRVLLQNLGHAYQSRVIANFSESRWLSRLTEIYAAARPVPQSSC